MNPLERLALEIISPAQCADCPNRSPLSRAIARTALGVDYTGDGCDPALIKSDGDLRNELFDSGETAKPYGFRVTPEYAANVLSGALQYAHPRRVTVDFRFGFSSLVCPNDMH